MSNSLNIYLLLVISIKYSFSYFQCFDNNREALLEAYNKNVLFSMALNISKENVFKPYRFGLELIKESRNLTKIPESDGNIVNFHYNQAFK